MKDKRLVEEVLKRCREYFKTGEDGIEIVKEFENGKSGNKVFMIEVSKSAVALQNGKYVIKISGEESAEFLDEILNTVELGKNQNNIGQITFPRYETGGRIEGGLYYIYDVAGKELNSTIKLSGTMETGESILESISRDLLIGWNANFINEKVSLNTCIRKMIGEERLNTDGRIAERITNLIGDGLAPAYKYENSVYPNPYYYLVNDHGPLEQEILAVKGNIHGDLNINNIIIQKNVFDNSFEAYLIDYSHYQRNGFLFFDHEYLQMDLFLTGQSTVNIYEWRSDIEASIKFDSNINTQNRFVRYIKNGIDTFINKYQSRNKQDCLLQCLCAQIAAGLNWMNKKGSEEKRQALCLLYASIYLKELLRILKHESPQEATAELSLLGGDNEREIWNKIDKFNVANNRYILISSCESEKISKELFASFLGVRWESIFHITKTIESEIRDYFLPRIKKKYGIQYVMFPTEHRSMNYEISPAWCSIQIPESGNLKLWYKREIQDQMNKLLKSILSIRENETIYLIVDVSDWNYKIIEEIITDMQINSGRAQIRVIGLNNYNMNLESDEYLKVEYLPYTLHDVALCASVVLDKESDCRKVWIPKKDIKESRTEKVYLEDDEVSYVSMDFEIIHHALGWNEECGDAGEAFYHGAEPSWKDIAERRDIEREDYVNKWKEFISNKMKSIGSSMVISINLLHRAGAGGTTLSRRILWDFHSVYPCLRMKKIENETIERLKLIYNKSKLPILVVVEITAGSITQIDINNLRVELINKNIRALFICVSRVNNIKVKRHEGNLYLASTPDMTMEQSECEKMYYSYAKMTKEQSRWSNLEKLTWGDKQEWGELRQPFFYGLFAFDEEYSNIQTFVKKSMQNVDGNFDELILALAFMTQYSQIGLSKSDIKHIFEVNVDDEDEKNIMFKNNPLIIQKSVGYQICHPVIARHILQEKLGNKSNELLEYAKQFVDMMTNAYSPDSSKLNDILEEIFTHREYYVDEERYKFSNLIMEFADENKRSIFNYIIEKLPNNPHYYNHLARVYIYPSENNVCIDFEKAIEIAKQAISKSELAENEGIGIHHHLLGKIYTKKCKFEISHSKFQDNEERIWKGAKPVYESAEIEFSKCTTGNNMAYGLIGRIELISGVLMKFSQKKRSSINFIIQRNPGIKGEFAKLIENMHKLSLEYTMKFGNENMAYVHAMTDFYKALGNISALKEQLGLRGLTLQERLYMRRTITALEIWGNGGKEKSLYYMSEDSLQKIFNLISKNIEESSEPSRHDCIMWLKTYMRMKEFDVSRAYNFLMNWPDGDRDYYVCFYRYVFGFILYYDNKLDFDSVEKHIKQSNILSKNLYGISVTSTRELVGANDNEVYLIADNAESQMGKLTNEEREEYRNEHCMFFDGQISSFINSMISIKFSLDNVHSFIAKVPAVEEINGMNVGDRVKFALGFSYSEMRAWNVKRLIEKE